MLPTFGGNGALDDLDIPSNLQNDISYCQISMRNYIKFHQALVTHVAQNPKDAFAAKQIKGVEEEINDIGMEQNELLKTLNQILDEFRLNLKEDPKNIEISKSDATEYIAAKLYNHFISCLDQLTIQPINVKLRKSGVELLNGLLLTGDSKLQDLHNLQMRVNNSLHPKQISLLKPKAERERIQVDDEIKTSSNESCKPKVLPPAISNSRINLLNALNKAKNQRMVINPVAVTQYPLSSGPSSITSSPNVSDESYEAMPNDDIEEVQENWVELNKEDFLKMFGLYTHEHSKLLQSRRSERRRRNVTSTEKTDFHYGKFDLLERKTNQHNHINLNTNKRGKPILLINSPIGTRGFKKRKQSHEYNCYRANEIKSKSSSSSSSSLNGDRSCNICNKNDDLLQICLKCTASFHIKCHRNIYSNQLLRSRDAYCPHCIHMKFYIANSQLRGK